MPIKQRFYLPLKIQELIKKSSSLQNSQLKIEDLSSIIKDKCGLCSFDKELELIEITAKKILKSFNKAIIISIGGSMSASRAFTACKNYTSENFKLIYSDSLSLEKQNEVFSRSNLKNAAIIIISRSGGSVETTLQTSIVIDKYYKYFGKNYSLGKHFFVITKGENSLRKIAVEIGANILEYVSTGGKFSALSMVGLLPARLIGLCPQEIIRGAKSKLANYEDALEAALINYHLLNQGYSINVLSHYNDLFDQILARYMQISSEIIAKEGKGFSTIIARGVFDQHGLWQLFLSGPNDKYFTFLCNKEDFQNTDSKALIENTYHKLNLKRLKEKQVAVREIIIEKIDSYNLGALSMHLLLEMMILANFLDIPSTTQPDIDRSKKILGKIYAMHKK